MKFPVSASLTLLPVTAHEIQCHCRLYCSQTPKVTWNLFWRATLFFRHSLTVIIGRYYQLHVLLFLFFFFLNWSKISTVVLNFKNRNPSGMFSRQVSCRTELSFPRRHKVKVYLTKANQGFKIDPSDLLPWIKRLSFPPRCVQHWTSSSALPLHQPSVCWSSNFGQFQQNRIAI